jgi:hypothetical protein
VCENVVLLGIFGPKTEEVTGEWRTLHNEELGHLCSSPNINRMIKSRGFDWLVLQHALGLWGSVHKIVLGKLERKQPLS